MTAPPGINTPSRRLMKGLSAIFCGAALMLGMAGCDNRRDQAAAPPDPAPLTQTVPVPEPQVPARPVVVVEPPAQPACADYRPHANYNARALTPGETKLAQALFGDSLDLSCLRLDFFPARTRGGPLEVAADEKHNAEFYGKTYASKDFSREGRAKFGAFVTVLTYLWQNQHPDQTIGEDDRPYYPLDSQYSFVSYSWQQQASIMEDYALRFLHPSRRSRWLPHDYDGDRMDTDPFLQALVENYFPAAKAAREAFAQVETRAITPSEEALIRSIFGDALNTEGLSVSFHPEYYTDAAASAGTDRAADFWGRESKSADFSKDPDAWRWGTFVHEFTHVWQFQTRMQYTVNDSDEKEDENDEFSRYKYPLAAKYKFTDYAIEQQAAIIEDYARRFLHPSHSWNYLPMVYGKAGAAKKDALLMKVVEDQFPAAKQTRLEFAQRNARPRAPAAKMAMGMK